MVSHGNGLTFGLPRMHDVLGERRDFLPAFVQWIAGRGMPVCVESGIGSGMGFCDADYVGGSSNVRVGSHRDALGESMVLVLRPPVGEFEELRSGATLISMLHFPTHPDRGALLRGLGLDRAIAIDCIVDDWGRRLVEDERAVAWNGLEAAFDALANSWPALTTHGRRPVRVTIMGAGAIGRHAVEAATKFGRPERNVAFMGRGLAGVEVMTLGRNMTANVIRMREHLRHTDVLVDATQRDDPSRPLILNDWLGDLPPYAVICDLVVDPYQVDSDPPTVPGIQGIPTGDLDRYVFTPDDPAWDQIPPGISHAHRRTVVSCNAWPGVHPLEAMEHYGYQLRPLVETLIERCGVDGLREDGTYHERALRRATLRWWHPLLRGAQVL
jgi:alanine dehydrogenase